VAVCLTKPVRQMHLHDALCGIIDKAPSADERAPAPAASAPDLAHRGVVLVAEDNPVNQLLARKLLEHFGYRSDSAANGREAVEASARIRYVAILMDCQMPEMDGFEATRAIRRREAGRTRVPIIAMTAHAMKGDRERVLDAGMDDYITKPVDPQLLRRVLQRWIQEPSGQPAEPR
jgi:CheY-like chemotaxis protein